VQGYERRTTYNMSNLPVRLGEYSYGRSLARFSATLGPTSWRIAYQKIQQALPRGGATHGLGSTMARPKIQNFHFLWV
jgi:bromodomain-containing protein 7/9